MILNHGKYKIISEPAWLFILSPGRVHAHAASALINFCEGVERASLLPYLDPIVERLLKLLNPPPEVASARRYVQEQAITTLAMVADASEVTFAKVCSPASSLSS